MADGVKFSDFPQASGIDDSDEAVGLSGGVNKRFSFSTIKGWLHSAITAASIGAVPTSRTVNGKALSSDIALTASDVGAASAADIPSAYTSNPAMDGTASPGSATAYARGDHVHPTDTSKADKLAGVYYGTCSTAAATQQKEVTISGITELSDGLQIRVKFVNAQSYNGTPTLKLNSLAAKNIYLATVEAVQYEWNAGSVKDLIYDQTSDVWRLVNGPHATATYYGLTKLSASTSSTSTVLAATPSAVRAAYNLAAGKQDPIKTGTMALSSTWSGSGPYTQTATITGVTLTANSKVDIQLTAAQTADLIDGGVIALIPENTSGTVTVTALGAAPSSALTLQITVTEVA